MVDPVEPGNPSQSMAVRARSLLLRPEAAWDLIDAEPATIEGLYKTWVVPLAAVPAVCRAVGMLGFGGLQIFGVRYRPSLTGVLSEAVMGYALTLASVYVLALVIDAFAPRFGGERSRIQAFKLAAYSGTAGWLAGLFLLLPSIGGLVGLLGGIYSLYLLYVGLPKLMRSEPDHTVGYFVLTLLTIIVLGVLIGSLVSCVGGWGGPVSVNI